MRIKRLLVTSNWEKVVETICILGDSNGIKKIALNVLEINKKAIKLYRQFGFEVEGV